MKRKTLLAVLMILLVFTMVFAGCKPKRTLKNMEKYYIEQGYQEDYFLRFDNFIFKALLKQFGLSGGLGYFTEEESFLVLEMLEGTTEEDVLAQVGDFMNQLNAMGTSDMGELGTVADEIAMDPDAVKEYIDTNEPFLLIHDNTNSQLINLFMAF